MVIKCMENASRGIRGLFKDILYYPDIRLRRLVRAQVVIALAP
jgi:hypothetical protein